MDFVTRGENGLEFLLENVLEFLLQHVIREREKRSGNQSNTEIDTQEQQVLHITQVNIGNRIHSSTAVTRSFSSTAVTN
jgi:hypothetical protein